MAINIDSCIRERVRERTSVIYSPDRRQSVFYNKAGSSPSSMVRSSQPLSRPVPETSRSAPAPCPPSPQPMQIGQTCLTPEERSRRFRENLCLYCGGQGHCAMSCLVKGPPRRVAAEPSHYEDGYPLTTHSYSPSFA